MRITSIEALEKIKKNGVLSKRRLQVYEYVCSYPGCTEQDATRALDKGNAHGSITSRFSELEENGLIKVTSAVKVKGYNQNTYEITGRTELKSELHRLADKLKKIENQISKLYARAEIIRVRISKIKKTDQLTLGV